MPKTSGYESHADTYDQWFDENPEVYQAEVKAIQTLLPDGKGIEIGAGSGRFTGPLNIDTGVEPAAAMREIATKRGLNVITGVAESLPIEDKSYDFAIFITSTCFLDNPAIAYQEAARVIKDSGSIVIAFLEKNSELGKVYEEHKHDNPLYCDATFYSYSEIVNCLKQAGFDQFQSVQTVLPESQSKYKTSDIVPGHDLGAFVVLKAEKSNEGH
ncbi:MAG: methyltransferase domain-containing protein [Pseudomonadota bacterium]|nr:methyltransferase domain-containing protein [Pseudomonadota bacterium]